MNECKESIKAFVSNLVYYPEDHTNFFLEEKCESGKGKSYFSCAGQCIVIKAGRSGPLIWSLRNAKIGEGSIITKDQDGYHLHLLEMKSKLTQSEWAKALLQFEGMHLTTLAVARLLGVIEVQSVTCYIAYKQDALSAIGSADLILMKTFVGMANPVGGGDAWSSNTISLPITGNAALRKAQRDNNADAHFGNIG